MSIIDTIADLFGGSDSQFTAYRCGSCENAFESYKPVDDVTCPDCLSHNVDVAGDTTEGEAASD